MEDLSLHVLDIAENAVTAGAKKVDIRVTEDEPNDLLSIEIADDGKGMNPQALKKATDPFFTTSERKKVGLGLSLLAQAVRECDGQLEIEVSWLGVRYKWPVGSEGEHPDTASPQRGTVVKATFKRSHIDRKPLGDMAQTLTTLVAGHPDVRFTYVHRKGETEYSLDTAEM